VECKRVAEKVERVPPGVLRKNIILKELEGTLRKECDSMGVRGEIGNSGIW
jgi:hypothetical protein